MYLKAFTIFLLFAVAQANYGHHCGSVNAPNGPEPIDALDQICQVYNLCVKAQTSCFCNEQLSYNLMGFAAVTTAQQVYKNNTLASINLNSCPVMATITNTYYFPGCENTLCSFHGFTYLPIFGYHNGVNKNLMISSLTNSLAYMTTLTTYTTSFISLANSNPANTYLHLTPAYTAVSQGQVILPSNYVLLFLNKVAVNPSAVQMTMSGLANDILLQNCTSKYNTCEQNVTSLINQLNNCNTEINELNIEIEELEQTIINLEGQLTTCQNNYNTVVLTNNNLIILNRNLTQLLNDCRHRCLVSVHNPCPVCPVCAPP